MLTQWFFKQAQDLPVVLCNTSQSLYSCNVCMCTKSKDSINCNTETAIFGYYIKVNMLCYIRTLWSDKRSVLPTFLFPAGNGEGLENIAWAEFSFSNSLGDACLASNKQLQLDVPHQAFCLIKILTFIRADTTYRYFQLKRKNCSFKLHFPLHTWKCIWSN